MTKKQLPANRTTYNDGMPTTLLGRRGRTPSKHITIIIIIVIVVITEFPTP